jgi:hypothetical protein
MFANRPAQVAHHLGGPPGKAHPAFVYVATKIDRGIEERIVTALAVARLAAERLSALG